MATTTPTPAAAQENPYYGTGTEYDTRAPHDGMSVSRYLATRIPTLKPPMMHVPNPIRLLMMLNAQQWAFFFVAFLGWSMDAFDFFSVSLTTTDLATTFDKNIPDITWGITLVLMFRSLGSALFGIAADRYGRKWPFILNNVLFIVLELGTGFTQTYSQFLACRALFGIAMGGLYGNAAATALEDCPAEARGLMSGILQQGYAFGYLLAAAFARGLVDTTSHGWRPLFWFAACPPVLIILFRLCLPETQTYRDRIRVRDEVGQGVVRNSITNVFLSEGKVAVKRHWLLLLYLVLLMTGFNFMSHGSQDLYPTLLKSQLGFDPSKVTVTQVVANLGAMLGGTVVGFLSQAFGRRFSIIVCCIMGGALLYPYGFVSNTSIMAAAFFEQFMVQGAWGVIPIHLMELSPGAFRTFVVGTAYQLGNLVSSASATIEARLGENFPLPPLADGTPRNNYGKVIAILMACVYVYTIILTVLGPEHLQRNLDVMHDDNTRAFIGDDTMDNIMGRGIEKEGAMEGKRSDVEQPAATHQA